MALSFMVNGSAERWRHYKRLNPEVKILSFGEFIETRDNETARTKEIHASMTPPIPTGWRSIIGAETEQPYYQIPDLA